MDNYLSDKLNLKGKKVILRLDLNVPIQNGSITEISRIQKILPTLKMLINMKAKIIIISHIGRPGGKKIKELSLVPISKKLSSLLNTEVLFEEDILAVNLSNKINDLQNGTILMFENIRFYEQEEKNDLQFSKKLADLGDIYINDAFSCSHRSHSSVVGITKYISSYFGLQISDEINALKKITTDIAKPITLIIGGSKISTKINIINNLIKKFDNMIVVGGMANTILAHQGVNVGKSICEKNCKDLVKEILDNAKKYNCKINLPIDVCVSKNLSGSKKEKKIDKIDNEEMILDIGNETMKNIQKIVDNSKTILWNGPAGYFENPHFQTGTKNILNAIANKTIKDNIFSVAGGGETVAAINKFGDVKSFTFVSTAGGAFLEYLEGKTLPGIKALNNHE